MPASFQDEIAIVGMACRFAGAADLANYWRNIVDNRQSIGDHSTPDAARLLDATSPRFDRLSTLRGGFLRELNTFTPSAFGMSTESLAGMNPDVFLALHLASSAMRDAGLEPRQPQVGRASLFLGYASPVNAASANWLQHGLVIEQTTALLQRLFPTAAETQLNEIRQAMRAALPPINKSNLRSAFGHALAGQCATTLGLTGCACAVDAGAASSLLAIRQAMDELRSGRCDVALAGAVQSCASPQVLMGLASLLEFTTRDAPCPLSRDADGALPGEGGGFLALKRRRDAEKNRDTIYAVIQGLGVATCDPAPVGTRPMADGLISAMRDALRSVTAQPDSIGLVEAHGSGIPLEDQMEIHALRELFGDRTGSTPRVQVGSVKSSIGHCFAAAGIAGIIKTALALHHRLLPPMVLCPGRMHPRLIQATSPFYVGGAPRPWVQGLGSLPRRAMATAFDGAGMHASALLEERLEHR